MTTPTAPPAPSGLVEPGAASPGSTPPAPAPPGPVEMGWAAMTGLAVAWIAVPALLLALLAPDLISGSEQQHLPAGALAASFWGACSIVAVLVAMLRLRPAGRPAWVACAVSAGMSWTVAAVLGITGPTVETGSDPTVIPVAALLAPPAAAFVTVAAGVVLAAARPRHDPA